MGAFKGRFLEVWDISAQTQLAVFKDLLVNAVIFAPDDRCLIASGGDWNHGRCYVFDMRDLTMTDELEVHNSQVVDASFSKVGDFFLAVNVNGGLAGYAWPTRQRTFESLRFRERFHAVSISPDGQTVVASSGAELEFWQTNTGQKLGSVRTSAKISDVVFMSDGQRVAALDESGAVHSWHRDGRQQIALPNDRSPK